MDKQEQSAFSWGDFFITFFSSVLLHASAYALLVALVFRINVTISTAWLVYYLMPLAALVHTGLGVYFYEKKKPTRGIGYILSGVVAFVLAINIGVLYYSFLTYGNLP